MKNIFKRLSILWSVLMFVMISASCVVAGTDADYIVEAVAGNNDVTESLTDAYTENIITTQSQAETESEKETEPVTEGIKSTQPQTEEASDKVAEKETEDVTLTQPQTEAVTEAVITTQAETTAEILTEAITETNKESESIKFVWHEFASQKLFDQHYQKHVIDQQEFGDITQEEYLNMANILLNSTGDNILTKTEEDGDLLFYNVDTNEFAVLRTDGIIRTYFKPSAGIDYFNRQ